MRACSRRLVALVWALLIPPVLAQAAGLSGRVLDPQGAPVPAADLRLSSDELGQSRRTRTSPAGEYRFDALLPGPFVLEVAKDGFRRQVTVVAVKEDAGVLDVRLDLAGVD